MSHGPPKKNRRSGQRAAKKQNQQDSTSRRVNHRCWKKAIGLRPEKPATPERVSKRGSFASYFASCERTPDACLHREHKRLADRIASRRTGIMALVAKRAAIETELARRTA
jgi:hypothetical protein